MRDNDFETKPSKLWAKDKTKSQQIHYLIWISSLTFPLLDQVMVSWLEGGGGVLYTGSLLPLWMKFSGVTIQMKPLQQYCHMVVFI